MIKSWTAFLSRFFAVIYFCGFAYQMENSRSLWTWSLAIIGILLICQSIDESIEARVKEKQ
jgi:hypothetical protein